ncbi:hypothetical protein A2U01_0033260, partial [Trifolium medium]|nr:hypothetical protein [Trifolium medium]
FWAKRCNLTKKLRLEAFSRSLSEPIVRQQRETGKKRQEVQAFSALQRGGRERSRLARHSFAKREWRSMAHEERRCR